jgi:hypothetical protein
MELYLQIRVVTLYLKDTRRDADYGLDERAFIRRGQIQWNGRGAGNKMSAHDDAEARAASSRNGGKALDGTTGRDPERLTIMSDSQTRLPTAETDVTTYHDERDDSTTKFMRTALRVAGAVLVVAAVLAGTSGMNQPAAAEDDLHHGPETCVQGYVWRQAFDGDGVCVKPEFRTQVLADNAETEARRQPGSQNCISGYVWRVARPDDLVCVKPEMRSQVATQNTRPDANKQAFAPGTHTIDLGVARHLKRVVSNGFNDCKVIPVQNDKLLVGWQQYEDDGTPCMAESSQVAVLFDTKLLDRIPDKVITRAVLTYDEKQATGCNQGLPGGGPCWTSGSRQPEPKPNGCIVVRIPSTDWTASAPNGEFPYTTHPSGRPTVKRLDVRAWDVTEPFRWQKELSAMPLQPPTGPAFNKGFGLLLSGGLTIGQLKAEDNTNCLSELSNIRLRTTYIVSEGKFIPPR